MTPQPALIEQTYQIPPWLPAPLRERLAGRRYAFDLPRAVKLRLRHPEKITVSEWAERHRHVTAIDAAPGPWDASLVPHTRKIMDTIGKPWVRQVWLCMVERSAKTQCLINAVCWGIDRGSASGNIFWLLPTESDARKALGERLIPVFQESPRIKRYLTDYRDDTTRSIIRFRHGIRLFAAWANSPGSMASYFGRLNVADEIDKFPERTSEGTDPITLFLKRAREDRERSKYIFASTPAQKFIYKGMLGCEQIWSYASRCTHCNERHIMSPDNLTADGYACPCCGGIWTERERREAYILGDFICTKGAQLLRPETVGYHFPALPNPVIPLSEILTYRAASQSGGYTEKCAWANGYLAEDYIEEVASASTVEAVLRYRSDIPRNLVPDGTAMVALIVDPQQASFNYEIWSIGYAPRLDLHLLRHGIVETFADLDAMLDRAWLDAAGREYRIGAGLIDSGGTRRDWQKHSRTVEVYEWCSRHRQMMALKGAHGRAGEMISFKVITTFPGSNKPIPGGLKRVNLRVDLFKDDLERRLAIEPDDPGALSFHADIDAAFAAHFTGETKDAHGDWQHTKRNQRIDYWDCAVYALALREIYKLRIPPPPQAAAPQQPPPQNPRESFVGRWKKY